MYILLLACAQPLLINKSDIPWNSHDKTVLKRAAYVCKTKYPQEPCLKVFIKKKSKTYNAVCGKVDER